MDENLFDETLVKVVGRFRVLGWLFLVGGSFMSVGFFVAAYDPNSKITINHVPTYDFHAKLHAAFFTLVFPLVGAVLALTPRGKLEALFRPALRQAADLNAQFIRTKK